MRKAQFELSTDAGHTAELVFFYFGPSGGGGVQANVDRWMKQFKDIQKPEHRRKNCGRGQGNLRPGNWHFFEWISIWSQDP